MLRFRAALSLVVLQLLFVLGCVQPHHTTGQVPQNATVATSAPLDWHAGVGPNNDPPTDCANALKAANGSQSEGATKGDLPPSAGYPIESVPVAQEFEIAARSLASFEGLVYYTVLPADYLLYRVIGKDSYPVSEWWTGYTPPLSKAEWRSHLAVRAEWNGASCLVRYKVGADGIKAWVGHASPQADGLAGWYLAGGGWQIFVPEAGKQISKDTLEYATIPWAH
jgi:hypothetical protein